MRQHTVIEIGQSSPEWWQAWLPVLGSALLFAAAMITLWVTNRTNRGAIDAADARDHNKWRGELIVDYVADFREKFDNVHDLLLRAYSRIS